MKGIVGTLYFVCVTSTDLYTKPIKSAKYKTKYFAKLGQEQLPRILAKAIDREHLFKN